MATAEASTLAAPLGDALTFPVRVACVDTGSNAIRFLAADFFSETRWHPVHYERVPIRLGHQVFLSGRLAAEHVDAAVKAFAGFREHLDRLEITHFRAVATSAVREARNGEELVERILTETGIELEMISGSEEARLVHLAVGRRIDLREQKWLLVDVGGGSVEVSLADDVGMLWAQSHTMGSVRLLEELSVAGDDPGRFRRLLGEYVSVLRLPSAAAYWQPAGLIATGGNIEALADFVHATPDERGVARLDVDDLTSAIELLARLSFNDKVEQLGLRDDRADVILPAAMVYARVAELAQVREIQVPFVGVKEGILLDLVDQFLSRRQHEERQLDQITTASVALGRRFLFDEAHGLTVARHADTLFTQLGALHGLEARDRLVLRAAAILHDIGLFISYKRHHHHSLYIISGSELPGFSPEEMRVVANVARYHRKSGPAPHHEHYMALPDDDRVRVTQLGALLRLADALDRQHSGMVDDVQARVEGMGLKLEMTGRGDLLLERWALTKKKNLFEETFGLKVKVRNRAPAD
ncbi:MAG: Ppx/GppA phosphatase family protein [Gemmatimonadota bacterium]